MIFNLTFFDQSIIKFSDYFHFQQQITWKHTELKKKKKKCPVLSTSANVITALVEVSVKVSSIEVCGWKNIYNHELVHIYTFSEKLNAEN